MVCCGHWAVGIGLFALMALVVGDDGWSPTAKPDYIKDPQCLPVKENDFKEYMELWSYDISTSSKAFLKSTFGQSDGDARLLFNEENSVEMTFPIYDEEKYVYNTVLWSDEKIVFDLISPVKDYPWEILSYPYKDTDPNIEMIKGRKFHFTFYHYIFVNSTHFFDAKKFGKHISSGSEPIDKLLDLQYISNIPNILMTPFIKKQVMQKCNKKYCVLNMDHPGSGAIWASETEHYVLYKNGVFLIANQVQGSNDIYYTLKHAATGQCYYFPDNLRTFSPRYQGLDVAGSPEKLVKRKPKLGVARVAVKEVCTTTPEPKKSSGPAKIVDLIVVVVSLLTGLVFI
ncbi:hypothetical protein M3Y95_00778300 [Aphelenchoides besseyi]|nr:hypothetical protein M3Y95_00778300 [Aphelenchoides besseyi]